MASSTVVVDEMRSYKIDRNFVFVVENEAIGFYRTDGVLVIDIENRRFELFINATEKHFANFEFGGFSENLFSHAFAYLGTCAIFIGDVEDGIAFPCDFEIFSQRRYGWNGFVEDVGFEILQRLALSRILQSFVFA